MVALTKVISNFFEESLIDNSDYNLDSLKVVMTGGESISNKTFQNIKNRSSILFFIPGYTSTEFGGYINNTLNLRSNIKYDLNVYSFLFPFVEYKIVDQKTKNLVKFNEDGLLFIRSFSVLHSYWNDEENTKKAIDKNRWYINLY